MKKQKSAAVTGTVAKWYNDVVGTEKVRVKSITWSNGTANTGEDLTFSDEDGGTVFWRIDLDIAGTSGEVRFSGDGIEMPKGKDIKVTLSTGTTDCWVFIDSESRIALQ